jgi:hypothetical protein
MGNGVNCGRPTKTVGRGEWSECWADGSEWQELESKEKSLRASGGE